MPPVRCTKARLQSRRTRPTRRQAWRLDLPKEVVPRFSLCTAKQMQPMWHCTVLVFLTVGICYSPLLCWDSRCCVTHYQSHAQMCTFNCAPYREWTYLHHRVDNDVFRFAHGLMTQMMMAAIWKIFERAQTLRATTAKDQSSVFVKRC